MAPSRQLTNHPDPIDLWLESQGYYRKVTARDGSCLFRAFSEQLYYTQKFHLDVRKSCVEYMQNHLELFHELDIEGDVATYLEQMRNPLQWGSSLEITALSHLYKLDVLIFKDVGVPANLASDTCYGKKVMLCFSHERYYDSVFMKEFTKVAGFCQSLVYEMLYKRVFKMKDVDFAVEKMLHYKPARHRGEGGGLRKFSSYSCNSIQLQRKGFLVDGLLDDAEVNVRDLLLKGITPFPYKVAKSLDPNIFRNVEFDVWIDYRRGLRHGFLGANNELQVGVKCLVKVEENSYVGHIQEMSPNKGPVVVFVEELGEKRTVPFESLTLVPFEPLPLKPIPISPLNQRSVITQQKSTSSDSFGGGKPRKSRLDSESKGRNSLALSATGKRRNNSRSDESNITDNASDNLNRTCSDYSDTGLMTSFANFTVDSFSSNSAYNPYQLKSTVELGMAVPIQTHVLMQSQQHSNSQILVPLSPRPEDVPPHWLAANDSKGSDEASLSPSGNSAETVEPPKDGMESNLVDENGNYSPGLNFQEPQINFNAPKSVLDDGTDLPMRDIQTLRFFYNLGNDVYRTQCSFQYGWGGYTQQGASSYPSTPNPLGVCSAKCACGPVCIATVPTIHRLLEPTTPPTNLRRRRKDSAAVTSGVVSETSSPSTTSLSQPSSSHSSPSPNVPPRFRAKGKNKKDAKAYEGQPLVHQPTLQIPSAEDSGLSDLISSGPTTMSSDSAPSLSVPYSPPYGYVYYPTSPVVPYSPVESESYFTPLRLQFSPDYLPDTPQSPQCFSVNGDVSVYGSSQYSMMPTSPHYLVPTSPGIYVGSPPAWSPLNP